MSQPSQLHAGTGKICINPPLGSHINGDFVVHFATQIHDDLFAKSLILKNQDSILLLMVVDICTMDQAFLSEVKAKISDQLNIPTTQIMISATHTHAAGSISEVHLSPLDKGYRNSLPEKLLASAQAAYENLQPAQMAHGKIEVPDHVLCRRYKMKSEYSPINPVFHRPDKIKTNPIGLEPFIIEPIAEPDPELSYFGIKTMDNQWLSIFANYSLHYVGDWENGTISADYYGYFDQYLTHSLPTHPHFVGIMSNGTSGDINIWDFQNKLNHPSGLFEKSALIGHDLAQKLIDSTHNLTWDATPKLAMETQEITFNLRKPTIEEVKKAETIIAVSDYESYTYNDENLRKIYAREQSLLYHFPDNITSLVQIIQLGQGLIVTLPGEYFAETGLELKAKCSNKNLFVISLANDNIGYVPPKHELEKGGYETWRCRYSCMEEKAEEKTKLQLLELLSKYS